MAIVAKNVIVGGKTSTKEQPPAPVEKKITIPITRNEVIVKTDDKYHVVVENDLEKKYNKKSSYQTDMIDI